MTEDEAKMRWCPFAASRLIAWQKDPSTLVNQIAGDNESGPTVSCIASACMAWRWHAWECSKRCGTRRPGKIEADMYEPCPPPEHPEYYEHLGYCGLAGKP